MHPDLRLGTRTSKMAVQAAERVRDMLLSSYRHIQVNILAFDSEGCLTKGDLKNAGGKGLFVKDLERRLLEGSIDCALHTLKDMPGDVPMHPELVLFAFLEREDPRDALVLKAGITEDDLCGAVIGTCAPRRAAILRRRYPGIQIKLSRGNVDSRMNHLDAGEFDGLVLSAAGLDRLGLSNRITRRFDATEMLPAVGQGIVCLQVRKEDAERCLFLRKLNDDWSELAASQERQVLRMLNGNCHSAIAAHCYRTESRIFLKALVIDGAGENLITTFQECALDSVEQFKLGELAAIDLLKHGAQRLL